MRCRNLQQTLQQIRNKYKIYKQNAQLSLKFTDRTAYFQKPVSDFRSRKKRFLIVTAVSYTLWWRCYIERYNER